MILTYSSAALDARFVGGLRGFMDDGPNPCRIELYAATSPGGTPLAVLVLAKPSGTMSAGRLLLLQGSSDGDLILGEGTPQSARMFSGAGLRVCDGDVSGVDGDGVFKVEGDGGGALLHAGGRAFLVDSYFF